MERAGINDGWEYTGESSLMAELFGMGTKWTPVTLPHDALISTERDPGAGSGTGYFTGGTWRYRRTVTVDATDLDKVFVLDFEGVYRDAIVSVNGAPVAHRPYGYTGFFAPLQAHLRPGDNEVSVTCKAGGDARWYSGAGIYRNVWLLTGPQVHFSPDGLTVSTPVVEPDGAVVVVTIVVRNASAATVRHTVRVDVVDAAGEVVATVDSPASAFAGEDTTVRARLHVTDPSLWEPDDPYLYTCRTTLLDGEEATDTDSTTFGIRSLTVDPVHGMRINGKTIKLRGACVHHDNGPIGAATVNRADERRIELLKAAGFNAVRSAHNPMSRAMLDACDRLGVLVMDEAFDTWVHPKTSDDYSLRFEDWWESDVEAMVRKDLNHPCVVLYSTGNEILHLNSPVVARWGRLIAEKIRSLDPSRPVTCAVNGLMAGGSEMLAAMAAEAERSEPAEAEDEVEVVNGKMAKLTEVMPFIMTSDSVTDGTAEPMSYLDVAGYNYMEARYALDADLHPQRVIVGSETPPKAIVTAWPAILANPRVIGEFCWTGWDYLGEAGVGRYVTEVTDDDPGGFGGPYPWISAWCGNIDMTGHRRPQSYLREVVFGLRADPYIAVERPERYGTQTVSFPLFSWTDAVSTWTWPGWDHAPVKVEVYADADEVELLVNGQSVGTAPAGYDHAYVARFETTYEPGEITALARRDGAEIGRMQLVTATGDVLLDAQVDRSEIRADVFDLAYVSLSLVDVEGRIHTGSVREITVAVDGPGVLLGLGSADPRTQESYVDDGATTFDGRALAVIRPTGPGVVTVTATADGCEPVTVAITAS